jgi:hypothetical protein
MLDIQFLVSDNTVMTNRKRFQRICHSCGNVELVRSDQLKSKCRDCQVKLSGETLASYNQSHPEASGNASRKHGMHKTRLYRIHKSMMERCGHMGTRHKWAMYYEDRGIHVCSEWHNREAFFAWALSNGYTDELELDRVDNEKGYQPDNCRWVTHLVNMRNRRKSATTPSAPSCSPSFSLPVGTASTE